MIQGEAFQGQLKMHSKYEEELWFRATFLSANDMYGEVEKVIFLANEITKEKEMELASRRKHEQLIRKEEELRMASLDLKKKLDDSNRLRREEKERLDREVKQYTHVLDELPHSVITINNLGFVLFFNRTARKILGLKAERGSWESGKSPLRAKSEESLLQLIFAIRPGVNHPECILISKLFWQMARCKHWISMLIRTDLKDEVHYTLVILSHR